MRRKRCIRRFLSILLAAVLVLGDCSPLQAAAAAQDVPNVSGSAQTSRAPEESGGSSAGAVQTGQTLKEGGENNSESGLTDRTQEENGGNDEAGENSGRTNQPQDTAGTVSGNDAGESMPGGGNANAVPGNDGRESAASNNGTGSVSGNDMADTVSGNDAEEAATGNDVTERLPGREPERFYEEATPEHYGTLVSYDSFSRTYHVDGNRYVTVIGYGGSTYIDGEGQLQAVDNRLVENETATFSTLGAGTVYVNRANDYVVSLSDTVSEGGALLSMTDGEHALWVVPAEGAFRDGVVRDNAIRYSDVFPGIDYQYTVLGSSVKEDIILLSPVEKNSFSWLVCTEDLQAALIGNALYLYEEGRDPEREAAFVLEAPEMEDAAGEISFGVRLELAETSEGYLMTVHADEGWLTAPERVYPVRIDPTAIQVPKSAIHAACAEEGSPRTVIGDNSYPYVGYDDGITSGNLAGFNSKHLNCRTYFSVDYDFAALAEEQEIVSATFQVTQRTRWSKGKSEFGLYGVEEEWKVNQLNWNNQLDYHHYFLDSLPASTVRGQALSYDVTEEVSAWINGAAPNHGFVMKAQIEAPTEEYGDAGMSMQCEVFYNNSSASYAPKLVISWTGELLELADLTLDDTTVEIYPVVERSGDKSSNTLGVVAHGLAKPGSTVTYQLVNGITGQVEAEEKLLYPDHSLYAGSYPSAMEYRRRLSNWQSEVFSNLAVGQVYYVTAVASEDGVSGAPAVSDAFLIYEEGALDLIPRIASHYGVELDIIMADMRMQDCLTKEGNRIFIRNPRNTSAYTSGELSEFYKTVIDGLLLGRAQACAFGHEPINLNTGNFYMEQEDASLADIGGRFSLSRQYNSKGAAYKGSLGYGWSFAYDERIGELSDGSVIWTRGDGGIMTFSRTENGYAAPLGYSDTLTEEENGYKVTIAATGEQHLFNAYGLLAAIVDVSGNRTSLAYDMEFHLRQVTSPSGKIFSILLDDEERIASVTLPDGGTVSYGYDDQGNLCTVTDQAGNILRFEYDAEHHMTAWYDENGCRIVRNEYDGQGRVVRQTDAEGGVVTLAYEADGDGGKTQSTDAEGNVTVYHYDSSFRTTLTEYPDGTTEECSYDSRGYLEAQKDRAGAVTRYTYDSNGNLLTEARQDSAKRIYSYNDRNQITSFTDYDGGVTEYTYNDRGLLVSVKDAEGGVVSYAYDDRNRLISMTDARGGVTGYEYDGACVASMTDAAGNTWRYTYDAMNRLLVTVNPLGNTVKRVYDEKGRLTQEQDEAGNVTSYAYDQAGAVTAVTNREGQTSTFTYDRLSRLVSQKDPLGNERRYTYDRNGNKLTETDGEGRTVVYTYDAMNRLAAVTDPEEGTTFYGYDRDDHTVTVTDRRGYTSSATFDAVRKALTEEIDREGGKTVYETDVCGRIEKIIYADGGTAAYTWDRLSRMASMTNPLGMKAELTYDENGNVTAIRETYGDISRTYFYEYDILNRLSRTKDPLGHETLYTYDALGNLTAVTDGRGSTAHYEYDALSRLASVRDALGGVTNYTYDREGRLLETAAPEGDILASSYDAAGRLTARKDALGNLTAYVYDRSGRLLSQTDALGGKTAYHYDKNGNVLSVEDALGNTHTYTVDTEGNLLSDSYPNGDSDTYTYDGNGNVLTCTDRYGIITSFAYDSRGRIVCVSDTAGNSLTYTYDAAGNLLSQTDVLNRTTSYAYDGFGRLTAVTGPDGVTTRYEYDVLDRPVKVTDGEGKETLYEYDAEGNPVHITEPGDVEYTYTYDPLNRLTQVTDPIGAVTVLTYDRNGNLTGLQDGNGVAEAYAYDVLNRLAKYTDGNGGETVYDYDALNRLISITTPEGLQEQYGYDAVGNMIAVTDGLGQTTEYTYDRLYRLVQKTSPMGAVEKYTYDRHDIVTSVTDALGNVTLFTIDANGLVTKKRQPNGGSYEYAYDAVHRITDIVTPLGYETHFSYSAGDDILSLTDSLDREITYTYDRMHRVTSVVDPVGGITEYGYDVRGNRSSITDALGYTFEYTYDNADRLISVADAEKKVTEMVYDMVGNIKEVTVPGNRTILYEYDRNYNTVGIQDPRGSLYRYQYDKDDRLIGTVDPLGQTVGYTYDAAGNILTYTDKMGLTERYEYDAHGNMLQKTSAEGLITRYTFDRKDRMTSVTDPMGSVAYYTYNEMDRLTGVTDYLGRGIAFTYDLEGNLTSVTDAAGRKETMTYDEASRRTSYTSNGGNRITYDYDKLDELTEKLYTDADGEMSAEPVTYAYDMLGQRIAMYDSTGDTEYAYDGLGRIVSVTTYRTETEDGSVNHSGEAGDTIRYLYDDADDLSAIVYPDGTKVSYEYDLNGNLVKVTDRKGKITSYGYDLINRVTEIHRPNGISTYNTYNARDQITELVNRCDDCGWILGRYVYTYDDRGYIVAEHAEEAREMDPYGRQRYTPYTPEKQGENCDHGRNKSLAYRLLVTDSTFTYDDAGKLLTATEAEAGCSNMTVWTYSYDLMGNLSEKVQYKAENFTEISKMEVVGRKKYVYNENNQLSEATICDGKTTKKICYTYDEDGNLIQEYSPTDRSLTTYSYTVENRLEAVYKGNAYNRTLQMAAAYDGDGNRVYQLNYNPDKDEDFSDYYCSYQNCDYNGTGIQLQANGEVSQTEKDLMALIGVSGAVRNSQYELIEYINDVNREYTEVLVEQNINGRTDTVYTYGNERISREMFNQTGHTAYYLYDPRGSVSGLADAAGHLTKTYRYSANGELTFGGAKYENEYTYNGESYNPNIHSQYLRARYYDVTAARFLTEDAVLGAARSPLTWNRYSYCVGNPMNYRDPSGNIIETIADVVFTVWDVVDLVKEPSWKKAGYVVWDLASIAIPFVPGSYVSKAAKGAKKVFGFLDKSGDIARWGKKVGGFFKGAGRQIGSFFTHTVLPRLDDAGKWLKGLNAADKVMDTVRAAGRWLGSRGDDLLKLYDKVDDWLTGKASRGFDRLIDILNLSDDAEGILRMFQRELCQADKLYNRFHRGQQAIENAADSVKAAGGTLDDVEDIVQEIAEDAAKADDLPAVRGQGSVGASIIGSGSGLESKRGNSPQYLDKPVQEGVLNIGAGTRPIENAYNIDINPTTIGVHRGSATDLSNIATDSISKVIMQNPYKYDVLNPEIYRVLQNGGIVEISGGLTNGTFKKVYNMSAEKLRELGYEIVLKGIAENAEKGLTTTGKPVNSTIYKIILRKIRGGDGD